MSVKDFLNARLAALQRRIDQLESQLVAQQQAGAGWIPVGERLPGQVPGSHRSDDVLLHSPELSRPYVGFYSDHLSALDDTGWRVPHVNGGIKVAHWRPLPPPPHAEHATSQEAT